MTRILILQGHPDAGSGAHLCEALAQAYARGARAAGHEVRQIDIATLDLPLLRSQQAWEHEPLPASLLPAQESIAWAGHLVLVFPLWLGDMPALLKAFLEQVARPGFAFAKGARNAFTAKGLAGRSARVIVTMGMPAALYRFWFRAHSLKSLRRNILGFVGIAPVRETTVGGAGTLDAARARRWIDRLEALGRAAA